MRKIKQHVTKCCIIYCVLWLQCVMETSGAKPTPQASKRFSRPLGRNRASDGALAHDSIRVIEMHNNKVHNHNYAEYSFSIMKKAFSCLYLLAFSESTLNTIILCSHCAVVAQRSKLLLIIKRTRVAEHHKVVTSDNAWCETRLTHMLCPLLIQVKLYDPFLAVRRKFRL